MSQVRTKATHISYKYKIQIEPIQFEWDKFLSTLENDFPEILHEVLSQKIINTKYQIQLKTQTH